MNVKTDLTELVINAQNGDLDAFNELYNQSATDLKYVGYSILHKKEDVEDALQETYITIYRSFSNQGISPIHDPEKFLPWARQIMRNTCLNLIDHQKRKAGKDDLRPMTSEDGQLGMDKIDDFDDDYDYSPEEAAETEYIHSLLNAALSEIPAVRQTCLAFQQQGMTYKEIGEKLNIPEGTAKSHVRYAKAQLKKAIKEIEDEENVQLHGVVLLPLGDHVTITAKIETKGQSWITAELKPEPVSIKAGRFALLASGRRTVLAIVLAVLVAVGGVVPGIAHKHSTQTTSEPMIKVQNLLTDSRNEFYNPHLKVSGEGVHIVPYHIWYQDDELIADCYVVNTDAQSVTNIYVSDLKIGNKSGTFAEAKFGYLDNLTIEPMDYIRHRFVFTNDDFEYADLTDFIQYDALVSWGYSNNQQHQSEELQNGNQEPLKGVNDHNGTLHDNT